MLCEETRARSVEARISELLLRWEDARKQGQALMPEEICADCPELLEEVQRRIQNTRVLDALRADEPGSPSAEEGQPTDTPSGRSAAPTAIFSIPDADSGIT